MRIVNGRSSTPWRKIAQIEIARAGGEPEQPVEAVERAEPAEVDDGGARGPPRGQRGPQARRGVERVVEDVEREEAEGAALRVGQPGNVVEAGHERRTAPRRPRRGSGAGSRREVPVPHRVPEEQPRIVVALADHHLLDAAGRPARPGRAARAAGTAGRSCRPRRAPRRSSAGSSPSCPPHRPASSSARRASPRPPGRLARRPARWSGPPGRVGG